MGAYLGGLLGGLKIPIELPPSAAGSASGARCALILYSLSGRLDMVLSISGMVPIYIRRHSSMVGCYLFFPLPRIFLHLVKVKA